MGRQDQRPSCRAGSERGAPSTRMGKHDWHVIFVATGAGKQARHVTLVPTGTGEQERRALFVAARTGTQGRDGAPSSRRPSREG